MKTNAPPERNPGARSNEQSPSRCSTLTIDRQHCFAQSQSEPIDIAHVGAIWKSPRDKRQCIQAGFKSFGGSPAYLDLRIHELDATGRMQPTRKGITISAARVMQLAKLIGDAGRQAQRLGLVQVSS